MWNCFLQAMGAHGSYTISGYYWITTTTTDFHTIDKLVSKLEDLLFHSYVAAKQADYSKYLKGNLKSGECLIHLDFAENYSFVVQDAVQSFYWTNSQSTIHPVCAYYLDESGNLTHKSFCIISDHLIHDTNAVHTFLAELIPQLRTLVGN